MHINWLVDSTTSAADVDLDRMVWLWDVTNGTRVWTIQGHSNSANSVTFAPDGRRIASAGEDHLANVWDTATGAQLAKFSGHANGVHDLAFSPDSNTIASVAGTYRGPDPAEVKLWDSYTGKETANLTGHTSLVNAVAFFPSRAQGRRRPADGAAAAARPPGRRAKRVKRVGVGPHARSIKVDELSYAT